MKKVILVIAMLSAVFVSEAQTTKNDSSATSVVRKNEFIIDSQKGLMYRRNYNKVSLRVRVGGTYNTSDIKSSSDSSSDQMFSIIPSLGIQRNINVTPKFQVYLGSDLFYENYYHTNKLEKMGLTYKSKETSNSLGISPFIGIKYTFKRFVVGAENSASFSYEQENRKATTPGNNFSSKRSAFEYAGAVYNFRYFVGINF